MKNATPFQAHMEQGVKTQAVALISMMDLALFDFIQLRAGTNVVALDRPLVQVELDFPNNRLAIKPTSEFILEAEKLIGDMATTVDAITPIFDYLESLGKNIKRCNPKHVIDLPLSNDVTPLKVDRRNRTLYVSAVSGDETKSLGSGLVFTISAGKKSKSNAQRLYDDMVSYVVGTHNPEAIIQLAKSKVSG